MTASPFRRKRVGIFPQSSLQSENRLLASLAKLYPVDFFPEGEVGFDQIDAAIFFSDEGAFANRAFEHGVSSFVFRRSSSKIRMPANAIVSFSGHYTLHPAFRDARIALGSAADAAALNDVEDSCTLASHDSVRLWMFRSNGSAELHTVATEPPSLKPDRLLWEDLRPDAWLAPLPLLHFVRRLTLEVGWSPAPQRGCFIFDDPNLHSVRYGYIDYAGLAAHAREHRYHVAVATVPLDAWHAGQKAVEVFRGHRECLSLLIHGNDHVRNELGRDYSDEDALRMLAQALRRVAKLERKTGLRVARVMAPPHGGCSDSVHVQAPRLGIEALCTSAEPLARSLTRTPLPLDFSLQPAWFGPGWCPIIRRWDLIYGLMPLRLAAFLGQPIIAYGHHKDCAQGLGLLADVADEINTWSETTWANLETVVHRNYRTTRDSELMHVEMCSRSVQVPIPESVSHVAVHIPAGSEPVQEPISVALSDGRSEEGIPGVPFRVSSPGSLRLSMRSRHIVDPATVDRPMYRLWPPVRRALSMGRDWLMPIVHTSTTAGC